MSITADCHVHSSYSGDSNTPMESMIKEGIRRGLTHLCFTEHYDLDFPVSEEIPQGFFEVNTDSYLYELIRLREKYASQIQVRFGIEIGLQPHLLRPISAYARSYDFDFIIGSCHLSNRLDPYDPRYFEDRSEEDAYREYFSSTIENINKFSNFDVLGHLDYVIRYGPNKDKEYSYETYKDLFDPMLERLLENGKGMEINTAAFKYGLKEQHPCTAILKQYRKLGGEIITIGSDAHTPDRLCADFDRAAEVLKACGFHYYTIFEKRLPEFKKL